MFALGFVGVDFLVVAVVLVFVLVLVVVGSGVGLISLRGALLPVACRVETMVVWRICMSLNGRFEMGSRGWIVVESWSTWVVQRVCLYPDHGNESSDSHGAALF